MGVVRKKKNVLEKKIRRPHSHALPQTLSGFYTSEKGVIMTKSGRLLKNGKKNLEKRSRRWSNSSTSCPVNSLSTPIRALVFKGHGVEAWDLNSHVT